MAHNIQNITPAQVSKAYSGQARKCMCGCKGRYYVSAAGRAQAEKDCGYAYDDRDVNDAQVLSILRRIQSIAAVSPETVDMSEDYIAVDVGSRTYVVYLTK